MTTLHCNVLGQALANAATNDPKPGRRMGRQERNRNTISAIAQLAAAASFLFYIFH